MAENWKVIEGFENYEVSDHGRVRNKITNKFVKPYEQCRRMSVALFHNKKQYGRRLHNLVAHAFVPNPEQKEYVYNLHFDFTNCRADNLYWISDQERQQLDSHHTNRRAMLGELKTYFQSVA